MTLDTSWADSSSSSFWRMHLSMSTCLTILSPSLCASSCHCRAALAFLSISLPCSSNSSSSAYLSSLCQVLYSDLEVTQTSSVAAARMPTRVRSSRETKGCFSLSPLTMRTTGAMDPCVWPLLWHRNTIELRGPCLPFRSSPWIMARQLQVFLISFNRLNNQDVMCDHGIYLTSAINVFFFMLNYSFIDSQNNNLCHETCVMSHLSDRNPPMTISMHIIDIYEI